MKVAYCYIYYLCMTYNLNAGVKYPSDSSMTVRSGPLGMREIPSGGFLQLT